MNLIILFGPPASGKLTVGKALSRLTGYPLLHNHLTVDLVMNFFPFGSPAFNRLNRSFRTAIIEKAASERLPGLVMTYVWAFNSRADATFFKGAVRRVLRRGGRTFFAELACPESTLLRRVTRPDRQVYGKIHSVAKLRALLKQYTMNSSRRQRFSFSRIIIDTSRVKPNQAAERIVRRFRLPRVRTR